MSNVSPVTIASFVAIAVAHGGGTLGAAPTGRGRGGLSVDTRKARPTPSAKYRENFGKIKFAAI